MAKKIMASLKEVARVEVCGAFPEALLNACAACAIEFWDMECIDSFTLRLNVYASRVEELEREAARSACDVRRLGDTQGKTIKKQIVRRRGLLILMLITAALLALSSLYVWDISIYGNNRLSRGRILRALEECGVETGCYWPDISSDLVRSRMVDMLTELAWMSVNVSGSRAEILIVERREKPEIYSESAPADIIAKTNGVITGLSVLNGMPVVSAGQAVIRGETLVSGTVNNLSGDDRLVRALARADADTWYEISAVCPADTAKKVEVSKKRNKFAVQIGKRRINFYLRGRKAVDGCDKIIHKCDLEIEGLFSLPISFIREEYVYYKLCSGPAADEDAMFEELQAGIEKTIDGRILQRSFSYSQNDFVARATIRAYCNENIAETRDILP